MNGVIFPQVVERLVENSAFGTLQPLANLRILHLYSYSYLEIEGLLHMDPQVKPRKKSAPLNRNLDAARDRSVAIRREAMEARVRLPLIVRENEFLRSLLIEAGLASKLPAATDILDGLELHRL